MQNPHETTSAITRDIDQVCSTFTQRTVLGLNLFKRNGIDAPDAVARLLELASESELSGVSPGRKFFYCAPRPNLIERIEDMCPILNIGVEHFDAKFYPQYADSNLKFPLDQPCWLPGFGARGWDACRDLMQDAVDEGSLMVIPSATKEQLTLATEILCQPFISHEATVEALLTNTDFVVGAGHDGCEIVAYFASDLARRAVEELVARTVLEVQQRPEFAPFSVHGNAAWATDRSECLLLNNHE